MKKLVIIFIVVLFGFGGYSQDYDPRHYLDNINFIDIINKKEYSILKESYPNKIEYAKLVYKSKYNQYIHIDNGYYFQDKIIYTISSDGTYIALLREISSDGVSKPVKIDIYGLPPYNDGLIKTYDLVKLGIDNVDSFSFDKNNKLIIIDNTETCSH